MRHCDPATLSLVSLGEPLSDADRAHLSQCPTCQAQADQNVAVVRAARAITGEDYPSEPPDNVWTSISGELGLRDDLRPFIPPPGQSEPAENVVSLSQWKKHSASLKRRAGGMAVAAAAAGIAVGALGVVSIQSTDPAQTVLAESALTVVPVADGGSTVSAPSQTGAATIVEVAGQPFVEVNTSGLPDSGGYYEVWLIKEDLSGMISMGALTAGSQGRFTVPPGIDISEYRIVDVSIEPLDGDPLHSKESMLRGQMDV